MSARSTMQEQPSAFVSTEYYYQDLSNYVPPTVTSDTKLHIIGCIDPRCECRKTPRDKIQTPGGAWGLATDRQLAHLASTGNLLEPEGALLLDAKERNTSTADVHWDCKYYKFLGKIAHEMAFPSGSTLSTADRWVEEIYGKNGTSSAVIRELIDASAVYSEAIPQEERVENVVMMDFVRDLYPKHKNVHKMKGTAKDGTVMDGVNRADMYVVSHLSNVVQNQAGRDKKPQAYFDSLGALDHLTGGHGDDNPHDIVPYLRGARILRSAATRKVINDGSNLVNLEVVRRGDDIVFEEVEVVTQ